MRPQLGDLLLDAVFDRGGDECRPSLIQGSFGGDSRDPVIAEAAPLVLGIGVTLGALAKRVEAPHRVGSALAATSPGVEGHGHDEVAIGRRATVSLRPADLPPLFEDSGQFGVNRYQLCRLRLRPRLQLLRLRVVRQGEL